MGTNEYPIDEEFWKWWKSYFNEDIDLRQKLCYNLNIEKKGENCNDAPTTVHEYPPRLEDSARG